MRTRTLLVLVAISLSAGAAQAQAPKPEPAPKAMSAKAAFKKLYPKGELCDHAACTTVTVTVKPGKTECTISVNKDPLGMVKDFKNVITWKIAGSKATFTKTGINPKKPADWKREFDKEKPGDTAFTWFDNNPNDSGHPNRQLGYNIEVTLDKQSCHLDPIIINDVHS
jgi:hypothetical protein